MPKDILKNKKICVGFDPKLFTRKNLNLFFKNKNLDLKAIDSNLIDKIWKRKTNKKNVKFYRLPDKTIGKTFKSKIDIIARNLKNKGVDFQFISSSENTAWLLNIRGNDTEFAPIPHSYILIDKDKNIKFFCDLKKISSSFKKYFNKIKFFEIKELSKIFIEIYNKKFIIDKNTCSIFFENLISKNNKIIFFNDPIYLYKAIKDKKEIENIKNAHIYDGIALTKYLFWIKKNFANKKITEIDASQKLFKLRKKNNKFKFLSFPTISGTGPNGAIIHYKANKKTNRELKKGDIYLVDSGAQYEYGTTDVTRTISLNNSNSRIRDIFTRVLKGHIAVSKFKLKENTSGSKIDYHARKYLLEIGLDYPHSTGHGVGYFLNVHEGPQAISKNNKVNFQEGMVMSNEPGYYEKNKFGIRIENLIYVKRNKSEKYFENFTMVPIDKDLINKNLLNKKEKNWLNNYHRKVYYKLKNFMSKIEVSELRKACSPI